MPEQTRLTYFERIGLREEVRRLLFEGMKRAEQARNWEVFNRYMHLYLKLAG